MALNIAIVSFRPVSVSPVSRFPATEGTAEHVREAIAAALAANVSV